MKVKVVKIEDIKSETECEGCSGLVRKEGYSGDGRCGCLGRCQCDFNELYTRDSSMDEWGCKYLNKKLNTGNTAFRCRECLN